MTFNEIGIILEIIGFLFLLEPIQSRIWKFHIRNEEWIDKKERRQSFKVDPFYIFVNSIPGKEFDKHHKYKERISGMAIVLVIIGLMFQFVN